jgi:hypothetical protein
VKKQFIYGVAAIAALALAAALPAAATSYVDECVPTEAWTEVVPAVGEPTLTIDNPDYVPAWTETIPASGELTITVENPDYVPAWTESVEHAAVLGTTYEWKSWNWSTFKYDYRWSPTSPGTWWTKTGCTDSYVVTPAWTEYIEHPAVGEPTIVIDNPNYVPGSMVEHPAVGEPTITIDNPEYIPESVIEHPAVTCEGPTPTDPPTTEPPVVEPPVVTPPVVVPPVVTPPAAQPAAVVPATPSFTG